MPDPGGMPLLLFKHAVDEAQQHQHVLFVKLLHADDIALHAAYDIFTLLLVI